MMDDFITNTEKRLRNLVSELGWDYEKLQQVANGKRYVLCRNNERHRVPEDKLEEHMEKCNWKTEGYSLDDPPFPAHLNNAPSVAMTAELQNEIIRSASAKDPTFQLGSSEIRKVPKTGNRYLQDFTRDERLALYDYVVANTASAVKRLDVEPMLLGELEKKEEKKELTELELAAAERDAKRRRATYRNKVHTSRKTHSEIIREVIESQMGYFVGESSKQPGEEQIAESAGEIKEPSDRHGYRNKDSYEKRHKSDHGSSYDKRKYKARRDEFRGDRATHSHEFSTSRDREHSSLRHHHYDRERYGKKSRERDVKEDQRVKKRRFESPEIKIEDTSDWEKTPDIKINNHKKSYEWETDSLSDDKSEKSSKKELKGERKREKKRKNKHKKKKKKKHKKKSESSSSDSD